MGSEERWAQQQEWNEEKRRGFDVEINMETNITDQSEPCHFPKCEAAAVKRYEIKKLGTPGHGWDVQLCAEHDSQETAFELYNDRDVSE